MLCIARTPDALNIAFHKRKGILKSCHQLFSRDMVIAIYGLRWSASDNRPTKAFTCSSKAENPGALQVSRVMPRNNLTLHLCLL